MEKNGEAFMGTLYIFNEKLSMNVFKNLHKIYNEIKIIFHRDKKGVLIKVKRKQTWFDVHPISGRGQKLKTLNPMILSLKAQPGDMPKGGQATGTVGGYDWRCAKFFWCFCKTVRSICNKQACGKPEKMTRIL